MNRFGKSYLTSMVVAVTMLGSIFLGNHPASARIASQPTGGSPAVVNPTVVVSPTNMHNWFFYNDENDQIDNSLGSFVYGPGTPNAGTGSVQISVTGTQRRNIATYQFAGTHLANITTLAFSTYNPSAGNGGGSNRSGYLQFNVDFTGTSDAFQRRLVYIPSVNGTVVPDTWKEWNASAAGALWTWSGYASNGNMWPDNNTSEYRTWSAIKAAFPNARVKGTDAFVGIRVGEPYNNGYTENIDSFKFGTASGTTTFDFERGPLTLVVDDNHAQCNAPYSTIQSAINAAQPGDTVLVCPGTYVEQLDINKAITVRGTTVGSFPLPTIQSPASLVTKFTTGSGPKKPIVFVSATNSAVVENLTVDGLGLGNSNNAMVGVGFHNSAGTVDHTTIVNVRNTPLDGIQAGVGIYAFNEDASPRTLTVDHNTISGYQKNGMALNGTGLTANVTNNTVTGAGPLNFMAQNGIQIGFGGTGTISNNTVSGNSYTPNTDSAAGILLYQSNADTNGNTLNQNQVAISRADSSGVDSGNTIFATAGGTGANPYWGIVADAPPANRIPVPYGDGQGQQQQRPQAPNPVQTNTIINNTLTSDRSTGGVAIETDGGDFNQYGTPDIAFTATGNRINMWDDGLVVKQCTSGCAATNFASVVASRNIITNNNVGMWVEGGHVNPVIHFNNNHLTGNTQYAVRNTSSPLSTVDATNNWWGAVGGPITPGGSPLSGDPVGPNVNYTPFLVGQDYAHLTPGTEITVAVGGTVNLNLLINAAQAAVGQQSYLTFPPNLVQATVVPDTSTGFTQVLQNQVCNGPGTCTFGVLTADPGTIAYASGVPFNAPGVTGDFRVAQVTFSANTVGDATIHWQFSPTDAANRNSKIVDANSNSVSDSTLYQDYVIHIVNPQFKGHVTWQGRPAQPNSLQALPIHVTLTGPLPGGTDYPFDTTTDDNGNFSVNVNDLPAGNYFVRVKGPQYLSTIVASVALSGSPSTPVAEFGTQPAGDANNDNLVDVTDFSILYGTFGVLPFASPYDSRADFTGDNLVDVSDFALLAGNFGRLGNLPGMAMPKDRGGSAVLELRPQGNAPANGGTAHVGDRFVLELWVNAQPGTNVVAQQGYLTFPSKQLQLGLGPNMSPIAKNTGTLTPDNSVLDIALQNAICNGPATCAFGGQNVAAGSLAFASSTLNPTPGTGAFRVAQVTVQATAVGRTVLHWQFSPQDPNNRNTKIVTDSGETVSQPDQFVDYVLNVLPAGK